jgi:plasmid stabilization system protein ParE
MMVHRVVLTDLAEDDVEAVLKWFSEQRATAAGRRWYSRLMAQLNTLENHPERCPLALESETVGQEVRELLLGRGRYKYRILFQVRGRSVTILRIWHGSRDSITREDILE